MKTMLRCCTVLLLFSILFYLFPEPSHAASDLTTKYRVYQNDRLLKEFANRQQAITYAKQYANSYVEEIGSRQWIWHSFPKYQVYQFDTLIGTYPTLPRAIQEAQKYAYATVKNIESIGWEWNNYPIYQLYQGHLTFDHWKFHDLQQAKKEAQKWANAHIIDLRTNRWIWDNYSPEKKQELRKGPKRYVVYQLNYTQDSWQFSYLEDAIKEALKWEHSYIMDYYDENNPRKVFSNENKYLVYQYHTFLKGFVSIEAAIAYAKKWDHAQIRTTTNRVIWDNYPYYQVHVDGNKPVEFKTLLSALNYALDLPKSQIRTVKNQLIWDNSARLTFWAWTGSATDQTIKTYYSNTVGLDVIAPTWFKLLDAEGNIEDTSSAELVKWLKKQNIEVHPLVHNQFDSKLTSQFLRNEQAQQKFIRTLVQTCVELGVDGINIDFESLNGADRQAFTQFMQRLTQAAHDNNLIVSIDLPRGSISWNHLTAFDHAALAKIVDYIIIMTYDHHWSGSPTPGSVAGMQWTEQGIIEFLSYGIPRDQLIMGIPFYVREWKLDQNGKLISNRAIYTKSLDQLMKDKNAVTTWDPNFGQYKVEYHEGNHTYVFWLEDEQTVQARLQLAKKYRLAGVSTWRLGQESPNMWQAMIHEKN